MEVTQKQCQVIQNLVPSSICSNIEADTFTVSSLFDDGEIIVMVGEYKKNKFTDAYIKRPGLDLKILTENDVKSLMYKYW